jgi:hypothetical protein
MAQTFRFEPDLAENGRFNPVLNSYREFARVAK